jgi:hypothetical protein
MSERQLTHIHLPALATRTGTWQQRISNTAGQEK